ncbi:unnamed protein product [Amoebophrya sp. A25]|nr:unnamed protein product [Amoebophrya sp. A25]|eukprot:GSA25T00004758001.1
MPDIDCCTCGKKIVGTYFDTLDGEQCPACAEAAAGFCAVCKKTLFNCGPTGDVGDLKIHAACFECCECEEQIDGGFTDKRDLWKELGKDGSSFGQCAWVCDDCAETVRKENKPNGGECPFCGEDIEAGEEFKKLDDGRECHKKCFKCYKCDKPIDGKFIPEGKNKFCCTKCTKKCAFCNEPLLGEITISDGFEYHKVGPDGYCCFRCKRCRTPLGGVEYFNAPPGKTGSFCKSCNKDIMQDPELADQELPPGICLACTIM